MKSFLSNAVPILAIKVQNTFNKKSRFLSTERKLDAITEVKIHRGYSKGYVLSEDEGEVGQGGRLVIRECKAKQIEEWEVAFVFVVACTALSGV